MKKKMANHFIVLRPEYVEMDMFAVFHGQVTGKDGLIYCHTIKEVDHYLDIEAHVAEMSGPGQWVKISIPYHAVLYMFSAPDLDQKQALGFRHDSNRDDILPK